MQEEIENISTFSERLRAVMESAGEYPAMLAKAIQISHVAAQSYCAGQVPRADLLVKIARHYRTTTDYLLGLTDERVNIAKGNADPRISTISLAEHQAEVDRLKLQIYDLQEQLHQLGAREARWQADMLRARNQPKEDNRVLREMIARKDKIYFPNRKPKTDPEAETPKPGESGSGSPSLAGQKIVAGGMRGVDPAVEQAALASLGMAERKLREMEAHGSHTKKTTASTSGNKAGPAPKSGAKTSPG